MKVCVLFGGVSSEHEVSLSSAASVLENLDAKAHDIKRLGITKEGRWLLYSGPISLIKSGEWAGSEFAAPAILSPDRSQKGILVYSAQKAELIPIDVVFPVLHGKNGEDGTLQGLLELAGIPYVGCGVLSSALCMDKALSHTVLVAAGIPKVKLATVKKGEDANFDALEESLAASLGYPMFVKPANAGSSVGVTKAGNKAELRTAFDLAFVHDSKLVVEEAITGQEVECAVLGNRQPQAADVLGEIEPVKDFYDYDAKYIDGSTILHLPARLPEDVAQHVRQTAVAAYQALECAGLARVDFFVKPNGELVLNEINTLPGFTSISMYPKMFMASGMAYPQLLNRLLELAVENAR